MHRDDLANLVTICRRLCLRLQRELLRVHDDVEVLAELGLIERTDSGGVVCPFESVHIDMRLTAPQPLAA